MSRYLCPSCGLRFEVEASQAGQARCPQCLRRHGLEPVPETSPRRRSWRPILLQAGLLLGLLGLLVGAGLLWRSWRAELPRPGQLGVLDEELLRRTLIARGVPAAEIQSPFQVSPGLRRLAASAQAGEPAARIKELVRRLGAELGKVEPDLEGSAAASIRQPPRLLEDLQNRRAGTVSSLELASLLATLCREAGLPALLALAQRLEAPVQTASVMPGIGRYLVVVHAPGKLSGEPLAVLDPLRALALPGWAGGGKDAEMRARVDGFGSLDDGSAAAHLMAARALQLREKDPRRAYLLSEHALRAASPTPELHLIRASVLLAAGSPRDALAEVKRAQSVRDEPAGRVALARLQAAAGQLRPAIESLQKAIKQDPDYWPARVLLSGLEGALDPKRAKPHLEVARRVAPDEPSVLMAQAAALLGKGEVGAARDLLRRAVARRPEPASMMMLYQTLLMTGEAAEAKRVRAQLLRRVPADQRSQLTDELDRMEELSREAASQPAEAEAPSRTPRLPGVKLPDVRLGR